MKLGYCPVCKDIFKLTQDVRACQCGKSSGVLKDQIFAHVNGPIKILDINDRSLYEALHNQPSRGPGKDFVAFVLPKVNKSIHKIVSAAPPVIPVNSKPRISPYAKITSPGTVVSIAEAIDDDYVADTDGFLGKQSEEGKI